MGAAHRTPRSAIDTCQATAIRIECPLIAPVVHVEHKIPGVVGRRIEDKKVSVGVANNLNLNQIVRQRRTCGASFEGAFIFCEIHRERITGRCIGWTVREGRLCRLRDQKEREQQKQEHTTQSPSHRAPTALTSRNRTPRNQRCYRATTDEHSASVPKLNHE